jgi:hypothetical protein
MWSDAEVRCSCPGPSSSQMIESPFYMMRRDLGDYQRVIEIAELYWGFFGDYNVVMLDSWWLLLEV